MARTTTITFDQVSAAANAIKAANEKPTARRVREALGTGSMATILKFFQQWQGGAAFNQVDGEQEITLDPAIIKAISTAIAAQVAAAGVDATQRIAELEGERFALCQEVERLAADCEAYDAENQSIREMNAGLNGELATIKAENQRHLKEIETLIGERQKAFTAADIANAKLEASEEIRKTLEQRLATMSSELENSRVSVQACQARLESASREMTTAKESEKAALAKARTSGEEAAELRGMLAALKPAPVKADVEQKAKPKAKAKPAQAALPSEPSNG